MLDWVSIKDSVPKCYENLQIIFLLSDGTIRVGIPAINFDDRWYLYGRDPCEECSIWMAVKIEIDRGFYRCVHCVKNGSPSRSITHWMSVPELPQENV